MQRTAPSDHRQNQCNQLGLTPLIADRLQRTSKMKQLLVAIFASVLVFAPIIGESAPGGPGKRMSGVDG